MKVGGVIALLVFLALVAYFAFKMHRRSRGGGLLGEIIRQSREAYVHEPSDRGPHEVHYR